MQKKDTRAMSCSIPWILQDCRAAVWLYDSKDKVTLSLNLHRNILVSVHLLYFSNSVITDLAGSVTGICYSIFISICHTTLVEVQKCFCPSHTLNNSNQFFKFKLYTYTSYSVAKLLKIKLTEVFCINSNKIYAENIFWQYEKEGFIRN